MKKEVNLIVILSFILSICLGLILIFATEKFLLTTDYIFVTIFALIGLANLMNFIFDKDYQKHNYFNLILGIICLWFSLFTYVYYSLFIIILPIILSLYAFIIVIINIIKFIENKNKEYLIIAIISLILGILLIFRPTLSVYIYLKIMGVYLIINTIILIIDSLKIKKKKIHQKQKILRKK